MVGTRHDRSRPVNDLVPFSTRDRKRWTVYRLPSPTRFSFRLIVAVPRTSRSSPVPGPSVEGPDVSNGHTQEVRSGSPSITSESLYPDPHRTEGTLGQSPRTLVGVLSSEVGPRTTPVNRTVEEKGPRVVLSPSVCGHRPVVLRLHFPCRGSDGVTSARSTTPGLPPVSELPLPLTGVTRHSVWHCPGVSYVDAGTESGRTLVHSDQCPRDL